MRHPVFPATIFCNDYGRAGVPRCKENVVVLLTGATGFIGRHLVRALTAAGHEVRCVVRNPTALESFSGAVQAIRGDFTVDHDPRTWVPRLAGVDAVINAVGILRERGNQTFEAIHVRAPAALFEACAMSGVKRVIQISALGADENARSGYHISKRRADEALMQQPVDWCIVQPSLIYGPGGTSARLFTCMASLPLIPVPGRGEQLVQPVHIQDVVQSILALLSMERIGRSVLPLVGPVPLQFREFLAILRNGMQLGRAHFMPVPMGLVRTAATFGAWLPGGLLDRETLEMLIRGNTGDLESMQRILRRGPRPAEEFISPDEARDVRTAAKLQWLLPILRLSIAAVWIFTGIVSLGVYPMNSSYELLARVGVTGMLAPVLLYGAALMDFAFGIATLVMRKRRLLWLAQISVIVLYTLIITFRMPDFWLHPFGPILKNLPMLAGIWLLYELEER